MTKRFQKVRGFIRRHLLNKADVTGVSENKMPSFTPARKPRSHWKRIADKQLESMRVYCTHVCRDSILNSGIACKQSDCPLRKHFEVKP